MEQTFYSLLWAVPWLRQLVSEFQFQIVSMGYLCLTVCQWDRFFSQYPSFLLL